MVSYVWLDDFRRRTAWNSYANRRHYDAPANPWCFVHVDPTVVEYIATVSLKWGLNRVQRGDWDCAENCRSLDSIYIEEGLTQRFVKDRDWTNTAYYETATERIADTGNFRGCQSIEELETGYLPAVDDLYADMRENGYRPNRGVLYADPESAEYIHDLEPLVLIGRNGEIIWTEGYHRLVLSQLLDIDTIPVYILQRHEKWQRVRDDVSVGNGSSIGLDGYRDHPDLQNVLSG